MILVRQYRHALGRTSCEIPAGVIEKTGASPAAAARRELPEETGCGGGTWREATTISPNSSVCTNLVHSFIVTGAQRLRAPHLDSGENLKLRLVDETEVFAMLRRGEFIQVLMVAPFSKKRLSFFSVPSL